MDLDCVASAVMVAGCRQVACPPQGAAVVVEVVPRFEYRFIGRFGFAHDPIAAFVRDGSVITVRRGDTIDGRFVVKAISANDVEIGVINQEETLRLSLDGWI